ncbi:hypothetical protein A9Q74_06370 [Colwellia sp. 39_35_sub15_T18]|nr:hypothetical protein A9Q74_06370 [Colwellia sp. 39_35_sub15_T18]
MSYLYAVMYKENAEFLGGGAEYLDGKVVIRDITEAKIAQFDGDVNRVDLLEFNPDNDPESTEQLTAIITQLAEATPNHKLGVLSRAQGRWIHDNHPSFKPEANNNE